MMSKFAEKAMMMLIIVVVQYVLVHFAGKDSQMGFLLMMDIVILLIHELDNFFDKKWSKIIMYVGIFVLATGTGILLFT